MFWKQGGRSEARLGGPCYSTCLRNWKSANHARGPGWEEEVKQEVGVWVPVRTETSFGNQVEHKTPREKSLTRTLGMQPLTQRTVSGRPQMLCLCPVRGGRQGVCVWRQAVHSLSAGVTSVCSGGGGGSYTISCSLVHFCAV